MNTTEIQNLALTEVKGFVERTGEDASKFVIKVQHHENILAYDYATGAETTTNEVHVVILVKDENGGEKIIYTNVIAYTDALSDDELAAKIADAFPSKEKLEEMKKAREEQLKKQEEMMKQMQEQGVVPPMSGMEEQPEAETEAPNEDK